MSRSCIECVHNNPNDPSDLAYACLNCSFPPFAGEPTNFKPKQTTNYDRLRAMSVEEMAELMSQTGTEYSCPPPHYFGEKGFCRNELVDMSCKSCWLDWLKQEAEDG